VPHLGPLPGYFVDSLMALAKPPEGGHALFRVENKPVDIARNALVDRVLQDPALTHVLFLDADIRFHELTLKHLLENDLPVVSGVYFARTDQPVPHVYDFVREDALGYRWYHPMGEETMKFLEAHPDVLKQPNAVVFEGHHLVQCDAVGAGMLLVQREVFEAIGSPWFVNGKGSAGGEDFDFCERAQREGFKVYADFCVLGAHELSHAFTGIEEFATAFGFGKDDAYDWATPLIVEVGPNGDGQRVSEAGMEGMLQFPYGVPGYLTYKEGLSLFKLALMTPPEGVVVELGTFKGKSAICLAQAQRRLICVDHDLGEQGLPGKLEEGHAEGGYLAEAEANLSDFENVEIWQCDTAAAADAYRSKHDQPVNMIFIDGDHEADAVRRDFEAWRRVLAKNAIIALHDFKFPGVNALLSELLEKEHYEMIHQQDNLAVIRKEHS
jgi:predicted O-methyltransferase YrrM